MHLKRSVGTRKALFPAFEEYDKRKHLFLVYTAESKNRWFISSLMPDSFLMKSWFSFGSTSSIPDMREHTCHTNKKYKSQKIIYRDMLVRQNHKKQYKRYLILFQFGTEL